MIADHFVIKEILDRWKNKDELREEFEKFSKRYPNDEELQSLYKEFKKLLKQGKNLSKIKKKLEELYKGRIIEDIRGDDTLSFPDRRKF
ncbi:MAG: hypothetical protein QW802_04425 [Candidatus Altiarchaeota archaeon]